MLTEVVVSFDATAFRGELLSLSASQKGHDVALVEDGFVGIADGSTPLVAKDEIDAHGYARDSLARLSRQREAPDRDVPARAVDDPAW